MLLGATAAVPLRPFRWAAYAVMRMPKENWEVSEGSPTTRSVAVAVIQSVTITPLPVRSFSKIELDRTDTVCAPAG
jgi:hypothetical protein